MAQIFLAVVISYILVLLQVSFLPGLGLASLEIYILPITILLVSLVGAKKSVWPTTIAATGGFFLDTFSQNFFGFHIILFFIIVIFVRFIFMQYVRVAGAKTI